MGLLVVGVLLLGALALAGTSKSAAFGAEMTTPVAKVVEELRERLARAELEPRAVWRADDGAVIFEFRTGFAAERARDVLPLSLKIAGQMVAFKIRVQED